MLHELEMSLKINSFYSAGVRRRRILLALLPCFVMAACTNPQNTIYVSRVIDGDSIVVGSEQVRLYGIGCPEKKQPGGKAATVRLTALLKDMPLDIDRRGVDRYGRTIADVSTADGRVSAALIRSGHCWWYQKYAKKDAELRDAEAAAKGQRFGVHLDPNVVPPWVWRKQASSS